MWGKLQDPDPCGLTDDQSAQIEVEIKQAAIDRSHASIRTLQNMGGG